MSDSEMMGIPREGESVDEMEDLSSLFVEKDEQEKETPAESSTEEEPTDESPSQEGDTEEESKEDSKDNTSDDSQIDQDVPFHKTSVWKEYKERQDRKFQEKMDELEKKYATRPPQTEQESQEVMDFWETLAGNDDVSKRTQKQFLKFLDDRDERNFQRLKQERLDEARKEREEQERYEAHFQGQIEDLKAQGEKFNETRLRNVAAKYTPIDENGLIDMSKALEIMKALDASKKDTKKSQARKQIAANTTSDAGGKDEPTAPLKNIRARSFTSLAQD